MRLKFIKCFCSILPLALSALTASAQTACPKPKQDIVVYFGNGIDTSRRNAVRSLNKLIETLGTTYNGATLRYDLAYNQTEGIALDLVQSVDQAGIEWGSQVAGWLNQLGLLPDTWNEAYQRLMQSTALVTAPELREQVQNYKSDILLGQKVVVVSHSQGNFYVNAAKIALAQELTGEQMRSFNVFGVAVPANNIAGGKEPYYTNHRDLIQYVPDSLPVNWTLKRSDGSLADDRAIVAGHSFVDTYMSADFDIRPSLVLGIKGRIDVTVAQPKDCDTYRKIILSMVSGNYKVSSGSAPNRLQGTFAINQTGFLTAEGIFLSQLDSSKVLRLDRLIESKTTALPYIVLTAHQAYAEWDITGKTKQVLANASNYSVSGDTPASGIGREVDTTQTMMGLMQGFSRIYPENKCYKIVDGKSALSQKVTVWIEGNVMNVDDQQWNLTSLRKSEAVIMLRPGLDVGTQYSAGFTHTNEYTNGDKLLLNFHRLEGLKSFAWLPADFPKNSFSCDTY